MQLYEYNAFELSELLGSKKISSFELTRYLLDRIDSVDKNLNAFITVCAERALAQANTVDEKRMKGESLSRLAGIPIGLKDNISLSGVKMTCGSKMLENYIAPYDATVVDKLEAAGAVITGKLNMDEFAMGSSSETSVFGAVKNPYDLERVARFCISAAAAGKYFSEILPEINGRYRTGKQIIMPSCCLA